MSTCSEPIHAPRRQRGEMLLEALIAVLVTSLIAGGMAQVQARVMQTQRATKVERLVVGQLREQIQTHGTALCGTGTVTLSLTSALDREASVSCGAVQQLNVSVGGTTLEVDAPARIDLQVAADALELEGDSAGENAVDLLLSSQQ